MPAKHPSRAGRKQSGTSAGIGPATPERIQKILARAGLGSRRKLEASIKAGEILINNKPAELGSSLSEGDRVEYHQRSYKVVTSTLPQQTLLYNKPIGEITSNSDPEGRRTVFDRLPRPKHGRWIAVGRLDINTSGLLILTTDGELANAMMHPSSGVDREYACRIHGEVSEEQLQALRDGVELDDGPARFSDIATAGSGDTNQWYQVTIMEGRNREVRRLWNTQGVEVSRLQRVRYGAAFLPKGLRRGQWQQLDERDHKVLREDVKLPAETRVLTLQSEKTARPPQAKTKPGRRQPVRKKAGKTYARKTSAKPRGKLNPNQPGRKPMKGSTLTLAKKRR